MHANEGAADVLVDALIAAGAAFSGSLALGGGIAEPRAALGAAAIAMGVAFFGSLAVARGRPVDEGASP